MRIRCASADASAWPTLVRRDQCTKLDAHSGGRYPPSPPCFFNGGGRVGEASRKIYYRYEIWQPTAPKCLRNYFTRIFFLLQQTFFYQFFTCSTSHLLKFPLAQIPTCSTSHLLNFPPCSTSNLLNFPPCSTSHLAQLPSCSTSHLLNFPPCSTSTCSTSQCPRWDISTNRDLGWPAIEIREEAAALFVHLEKFLLNNTYTFQFLQNIFPPSPRWFYAT